MLALQVVIVSLVILLCLGYYLYMKGEEKLGLFIRNLTLLSGLIYFILVIIIGLCK